MVDRGLLGVVPRMATQGVFRGQQIGELYRVRHDLTKAVAHLDEALEQIAEASTNHAAIIDAEMKAGWRMESALRRHYDYRNNKTDPSFPKSEAAMAEALLRLGERRSPSGSGHACGECGNFAREGEPIEHHPDCQVGEARRMLGG